MQMDMENIFMRMEQFILVIGKMILNIILVMKFGMIKVNIVVIT
jgi:hypothetical protein